MKPVIAAALGGVGALAIAGGAWFMFAGGSGGGVGGSAGAYAARACTIAVEYQLGAGPGAVLRSDAIDEAGGYIKVVAMIDGSTASCAFERNSLDTDYPALTSLSIKGREVREPEFFLVAGHVSLMGKSAR